MLICCRLFTRCKLRMTSVQRLLIRETAGRMEVIGLVRLTERNERPKSAAYGIRSESLMCSKSSEDSLWVGPFEFRVHFHSTQPRYIVELLLPDHWWIESISIGSGAIHPSDSRTRAERMLRCSSGEKRLSLPCNSYRRSRASHRDSLTSVRTHWRSHRISAEKNAMFDRKWFARHQFPWITKRRMCNWD